MTEYTDHESNTDHKWHMRRSSPWKRGPKDECPQCGSHDYGWLVYFIRDGFLPILWFYEMRYHPKLACGNCGYTGKDLGYIYGTETLKESDFAQETGLDEAIESYRYV